MNSPTLRPGIAEALSIHNLGQTFENNSFVSLVKMCHPITKFHYWKVLVSCILLQLKQWFYLPNKIPLLPPTPSMGKVPYWKELWISRPHTKSWTQICRWTWKYLDPDTLQNGMKEVTQKHVVLPRVLACSSIIQPQREIFHFLPLLPLSRELHISRPDGHLVQALISKKLVWLASWYNMFDTLFFSIWHTRECSTLGIWFTKTLRLIWEKGAMTTLWEDFVSLSSVYVLSTKGRAWHSQTVQG